MRAHALHLLAALSLAALLPSAARAQAAAHLPTPEDIVAIRQVGDPQLSPDGRRIAYTVGTPQAGGKPPRSRIWRVPFGGDAPARELPAPETASDRDPRWSPDGATLAFLSDRALPGAQHGDGKPAGMQVWQVGPDGVTPRPLTRSAGDVGAFAFSGDGRLAFLATEPPSAGERAKAEAKDDAHLVERPTRFSRLWIQAPGTGQARALSPPGLQVHDLAWAPDGRRLALRVSDGTTLNDYWYDSRVVIVDATSGELLRTLCERASAHPLQFSPDGRRLLYGELGPHGMTATIVLHHLAAGGERVALAQDWPGTLWLARWADDSTVVGEGQRGVRGAFLRIDAATGRATEIARPQVPYQAFTAGADGRAAFIGVRDDVPAEVWTLDGDAVRQRTATNPQVATWAHGRVRELAWRSSRDGREITGVLVTPPGWRPGTALPTLVQIHGGPAWAWWSGWLGSWHDWAQLLSTHGYAVLLPNPRGSEGQGRAFAEASRNDWGGADFQDVLDGLDLLEREGVADPARVAIGGWSYGGYLSAWAATQSDRFRTAIVGAGVIDIGAMALTTDVPDYLPGYFGDPLRDRATYDAHSPIRHAGRIRVPVLILHGDDDMRVPLSQGQMLFRALERRGVPVEMVRYPRGPHWFVERAHQRDVLERVLGWLDTHLRGATDESGAGRSH